MMGNRLKAQINGKRRGMFPEENKDYQRKWRATIYRSTYFQRKQNEKEKGSYGVDWQAKKAVYVSQNWIINSLKMYKLSDKVIKFIEKAIEN